MSSTSSPSLPSLHNNDKDNPARYKSTNPIINTKDNAQFHTKDRALHRSLFSLSSLIDTEDAIQQRNKININNVNNNNIVFSGWENVCDILVSRDDSLIVVIAAVKGDKKLVQKREYTTPNNTITAHNNEESSSDSDADIPPHETPPPPEKVEKEKRKFNARRPSSTTPTLPQLPSPTPSPPSTSPHSFKSDDDGKKDFLPKIDSKHAYSHKKDREATSGRESVTSRGSVRTTVDNQSSSTKLHMYSADPPRTTKYEPTTSPPLTKHSESKKSIPDLSDTPSRLHMYYPRNPKQMYSSSANASKKSVNLT